jgi:hypothetical protein
MKIRISLCLEEGDELQDFSFDMPDGSAIVLTPTRATVDVAPECFFKPEAHAEKHGEKKHGSR